MKIMGFMVIVRVSDSMPYNDVAKEIETSIGFGNPQVTSVFQFPDNQEPTFRDPPGIRRHTAPLSHDGYATHSHDVRTDHLGVHRKEWPNV